VCGEEPADMKRYVLVDPGKPPGQLTHLLNRIVLARDDQRRHLNVAAGRGKLNGAPHILQLTADLLIEGRRKALEVDVHPMDQRQQLCQWFAAYKAVGDKHVFLPLCRDELGAIPHKFIADKRLVVGVGHTDVALVRNLNGGGGHLPGGKLLIVRLFHGYFVVLAKPAAEIAAITAQGENPGAGMEAGQRFLFDRVQGHGGNSAIAFC